MTSKIHILAKYTYELERNKNNPTTWADLSDAGKASYVHEAEEQIEYATGIFKVLGIDLERTKALMCAMLDHAERDAVLMQENADLRAQLAKHDELSVCIEKESIALADCAEQLLDKPEPTITEAQVAYVLAFLNSGASIISQKQLLCDRMGIEFKNKKAVSKLWIMNRISQQGWDAVKNAVDTV